MTSTDTLLPCPVPWCVSDVLEVVRSPWSRGYGVSCQNCRAQGPDCATEAEAIAAWNRRTTPTPATDEREAVARALCRDQIIRMGSHKVESAIAAFVEQHWRGHLLAADAALSALAQIRAAEILAAEARGYAMAVEDAANEATHLWEYGVPAQEFPRRIRAIERNVHGAGE